MTVAELERPKRNGKAANDAAPAHVYTAIAAVMAEMAKEGIGKNNKNTQQGYRFRGVDDVYNALSRVLSDNHLCVIPRVMSREIVERQTKSGTVLFYVTVATEFDFVSAIDGTMHRVGPFYGEAMDSGDKATNKAMSAAYKYMAFQTFCIPTEGDNDADATTHEVAPSAAGGVPSAPAMPRQRRTNVVVNPATGKEIDTENARNQRPEWAKFTDRVQGFIDARDTDGLRAWFTSDTVSEYVAGWVFKDEANEHFEKALDEIAARERA